MFKYGHLDFVSEMRDNYYNLRDNRIEVSRQLDHSNTSVYAGVNDNSLDNWLYWIHELEILLIERDKSTRLSSDTSKENYMYLKNISNEKSNMIGLHFYVFSKKDYVDLPEWKHLEGAEETLRLPNQMLKMFTTDANDALYCAASAYPTWGQITKIKLLQYAVLKGRGYEIDDMLIDFVTAFDEQDINKINEAIRTIARSEKYTSLQMNNVIKMFEREFTSQITSLENINTDYADRILNYENKITELAAAIRKNADLIELYIAKAENKADDFALLRKYLIKHPYIKEVTVGQDNNILLYYEAPMLYYHEYTIEKIRRNQNDFGKKICDLFLERRYQLYTRCRLSFKPETFYLSSPMSIGNNDRLIQHPHIDRFSCLGNHRTEVQNAARTGDYIAAIDQISQAVLNLNFTDSCVIREMMYNLNDHRDLPTWYDTETNSFVSLDEIFERN